MRPNKDKKKTHVVAELSPSSFSFTPCWLKIYAVVFIQYSYKCSFSFHWHLDTVVIYPASNIYNILHAFTHIMKFLECLDDMHSHCCSAGFQFTVILLILVNLQWNIACRWNLYFLGSYIIWRQQVCLYLLLHVAYIHLWRLPPHLYRSLLLKKGLAGRAISICHPAHNVGDLTC